MQQLVTELHATLPGCLCAVYLLGRYADASAVSTTDLELGLIIADCFHEDERARRHAILAGYAAQTEGELDIDIRDAESLWASVTPMLKSGSRLLWGDDLCRDLPLMPLAAWTRDRMHSYYWRHAGLFSCPLPRAMPLNYLDPSDEFSGYTCRLTITPSGGTMPGTRDLIRAGGRLDRYRAGGVPNWPVCGDEARLCLNVPRIYRRPVIQLAG